MLCLFMNFGETSETLLISKIAIRTHIHLQFHYKTIYIRGTLTAKRRKIYL